MTDGEASPSAYAADPDPALPGVSGPAVHSIDFSALSPTQFEELTVDILDDLGYINIEWHKGTPGDASPADDGRDVTAFKQGCDADGYVVAAKWFVDSKHYTKAGVPKEELGGLLHAAGAQRADVALFVVSGFLSNPAARYLKEWEANNRPTFRIRVWDRYKLERLPCDWDSLATRHNIRVKRGRSRLDVENAARRLNDLLWYDDAVRSRDEAALANDSGELGWSGEEVESRMLEIENRYPNVELPPWPEDVAADARGGLRALLWMLGEDWDEVSL